jgi:hypothetical protein
MAATSVVPAPTVHREELIQDRSATATESLACRDYQVSGPALKKLCTLRGAQHSILVRLEVVRLQRSMLHEVAGDEGVVIDSWCLAHVLHECINPVSKEQTLTVRYEDGEVEDVCAGIVHCPEKALRAHTRHQPSTAAAASKAPTPACHTTSNGTHAATGTSDPNPRREDSLVVHIRHEHSLPPPLDCHASSMDDASGNEDDIVEADSESETTLTERRGKSPTPGMSEARSSVPFHTRSYEETVTDCGSGRGHIVRGGGRRRVMHAAAQGSIFRAGKKHTRLCAGARKGPLPALGGTISVSEVVGTCRNTG